MHSLTLSAQQEVGAVTSKGTKQPGALETAASQLNANLLFTDWNLLYSQNMSRSVTVEIETRIDTRGEEEYSVFVFPSDQTLVVLRCSLRTLTVI